MKLKSFLRIISILLILVLLLLTILIKSDIELLKKDNFIPRANINNSFNKG